VVHGCVIVTRWPHDLRKLPHPEAVGVSSDLGSGHDIGCDGMSPKDLVEHDQNHSV